MWILPQYNNKQQLSQPDGRTASSDARSSQTAQQCLQSGGPEVTRRGTRAQTEITESLGELLLLSAQPF